MLLSYFLFSFSSLLLALYNKNIPNASQKVGPVGLCPAETEPIRVNAPNIVQIHPAIFISLSPIYLDIESSSIFFEQRTTMSPITTLINEIPKAHPKPILRLRPRQPTPYAKATAITKKNTFSISLTL